MKKWFKKRYNAYRFRSDPGNTTKLISKLYSVDVKTLCAMAESKNLGLNKALVERTQLPVEVWKTILKSHFSKGRQTNNDIICSLFLEQHLEMYIFRLYPIPEEVIREVLYGEEYRFRNRQQLVAALAENSRTPEKYLQQIYQSASQGWSTSSAKRLVLRSLTRNLALPMSVLAEILTTEHEWAATDVEETYKKRINITVEHLIELAGIVLGEEQAKEIPTNIGVEFLKDFVWNLAKTAPKKAQPELTTSTQTSKILYS